MDFASASLRSMDLPHVQKSLVVDMMEGKLAGCVGSGFNHDAPPAQQMA